MLAKSPLCYTVHTCTRVKKDVSIEPRFESVHVNMAACSVWDTYARHDCEALFTW